MEDHVRLIFNRGGVGTKQASALVTRGLDGLGQVPLPFYAKVVATGTETAKSRAVRWLANVGKVGGYLAKGEVATNV